MSEAASPPYTLRVGGFDGPLDVLLALIERQELDITTISLAQVADHFLAYMRSLPSVDAEMLSEFISVGAKLLLIKSVVLLPRPERRPEAEEVTDPTDLTERLREYHAIKQAATTLREREESGLRSYLRLAPLAPPPRVPRERGGATSDLLKALERIAAAALKQVPVDVVHREQFSIGDKIELLRARCAGGPVSFMGLLEGCGRAEVVATFLAVLELLKLAEIEIDQDERYGDIAITRARALQ